MADPKPDRAIVIEPATTRTLTDWTPSLLKAARSMADSGNLELAADFCESAMGDDRVMAALSTRTKGLTALPLTFEAVRGTRRLVKALEAGEDWWAAFPSTAVAQLLSWGILLGVGLGRLKWTMRTAVERMVPVLEIWHPRHLRYDWQRRTWTVKIDGGKSEDIVVGDGKWILYMPYGNSRPWAFGTWRAISLWHLLKRYAIEDWGNYSSKHGGGSLVAEADKDMKSTQSLKKDLVADLFALQANGALVMPVGYTAKILEATADTWATFEAQKNASDMGTSVAILGQNLSTEVSGPVSTGATLHGKVLQVFIDADAETMSTCLHDQALVWWAEFNFSNRDIAPWPAWDTKPPEDQKQRADVDKTKSETAKNLASLGTATVNEVRAAAGLEPLTEGGDEIVKPAVPVTPNQDQPTQPQKMLLRSGASASTSSGLVQGQLYADAVADMTKARVAKVLDPDLVAVLEAIEGGETYEDARARLLDAYRGMSSDAIEKLTAAAMTMAALGGRHAINEDT